MRRRVIVMGVAGSGKTTIGRRLADTWGADLVDADDAHPAANVAKMAAGEPLTDDDRWPWLRTLRDRLAGSDSIVVTCSALKRAYRDVFRDVDDVRFVMLDADPATADRRTADRVGHFMKPSMVASQFADLEAPGVDEGDVVVVDASEPVDVVVAGALEALRSGYRSAR